MRRARRALRGVPMISPAARAVLAAVIIAAAATTAGADPRIDLDRCGALDRVALARAIDGELAGLAPDKRTAVADRVIVVECPDAVTAHLRLDPAPATGPIARSLDLGEVPGELRVRLVALAVVEVVEIGALIAERPTPPRSPEPPPADRPSGIDPSPLGDRGTPPGVVAMTESAPGATAAVTARTDDSERPGSRVAPRRALADGTALFRGRSYLPRAGVRIYPSRTVPMVDLAVDLIQGVAALGITAATGAADDPLGTVRAYLLAGTAGVTVACVRRGSIEACGTARITAGLAAATASAVDPMIPATSATAPYLELGGQLELGWRGTRALALTVDAGWAEGMIVIAGNRDVIRLDGTVVVTTLGVRW